MLGGSGGAVAVMASNGVSRRMVGASTLDVWDHPQERYIVWHGAKCYF